MIDDIIPVRCDNCGSMCWSFVKRRNSQLCVRCNKEKEAEDTKQREIAYAKSIFAKYNVRCSDVE